MRPTGTLEERLRNVTDRLHRTCGGTAVVEEQSTEGNARVVLRLPPTVVGVEWKFQGHEFFPFLSTRKNADGALLLHAPGSKEVDLHVVECKRSVRSEQWLTVKQQFHGALLRLRALCAVLGFEIRRVVCYTAFREGNDHLSLRSNENPSLNKLPVLAQRPADDTRRRAFIELQREWLGASVTLDGFDAPIPHRKLVLDPATGEGEFTIQYDE
jgi:hypothetical protein